MGPADTGERALVAEQRMELPPLAAEDLAAAPRPAEPERLRAEMCELGVERRRV